MLPNGNLANLNINITSNISSISLSLLRLQAQLNGLRAGNLNFGLSTATSQLTNTANAIRAISSSMVTTGTQGVTNFNQMAQSVNETSSGLTNALLASSLLGRATQAISNGLWTARQHASAYAYQMGNIVNATRAFTTGLSSGIRNSIRLMPELAREIRGTYNLQRQPGLFGNGRLQSVRNIISEFGQPNSPTIGRLLPGPDSGSQQLVSLISNLRTSFTELGRTASSNISVIGSSLRALGPIFGSVIASAVLLGAAVKAATLGAQVAVFTMLSKKGLEFNSTMEQMSTSFDVLIDKENKAGITSQNLVTKMMNLAKVTPLITTDISQGGQMLLNYGVSVEKIIPMIKMLGDVSGGNKEKFLAMSRAFGQASSLGRLQGQDLMQMVNAGFNPLEALFKKTGESMGSLRERMEEGGISITELVQAFQYATGPMGRFNGMMEKQALTMAGLWSTITDSFDIVAGKATESLFASLKIGVDLLANALNNIDVSTLKYMNDMVADNIIPNLEYLGKTIIKVFNFKDEREMIEETTSAVGMLIKGMAYLVNIVAFLGNLLTGVYSTFKAGLTVIGMFAVLLGGTILAITVGLVGGIFALIEQIGKGIGLFAINVGKAFINIGRGIDNVFRLAFDNALQTGVAKFLNPFISAYNATIGKLAGPMDLLKERKPLKDTYANAWKKDDLKYEWEIDNKSWAETDKQLNIIRNSTKELLESLGGITVDSVNDVYEDMDDLANILSGSGMDKVNKFVEGLKNLQKAKDYTDTSDADKGWNNSTKDKEDKAKSFAKTLKDAFQDVADEIKNASDSIMNFGKAFEKMTYDRFSSGKLTARIKRTFKEISEWQNNLNTLQSRGIGPDVINSLREMGVSGFGITRGLTKSNDPALQNIMSMWGSISNIATNQATAKVIHEHKGIIEIKGLEGETIKLQIADYLGKEINSQGNRYSLAPVVR